MPKPMQQVLDAAVQKALEIYDQGNPALAIATFLSTMAGQASNPTNFTNPMAVPILTAKSGNRADFEKAMRGFSI